VQAQQIGQKDFRNADTCAPSLKTNPPKNSSSSRMVCFRRRYPPPPWYRRHFFHIIGNKSGIQAFALVVFLFPFRTLRHLPLLHFSAIAALPDSGCCAGAAFSYITKHQDEMINELDETRTRYSIWLLNTQPHPTLADRYLPRMSPHFEPRASKRGYTLDPSNELSISVQPRADDLGMGRSQNCGISTGNSAQRCLT